MLSLGACAHIFFKEYEIFLRKRYLNASAPFRRFICYILDFKILLSATIMKQSQSPFIWTGNFTLPRCIWAVLFLFIAPSFFEVQANDTDNDGVADNADAFPNDPLLSAQPPTVDFSTTALGVNDGALDNSLELWLDANSVHGNLRTPANSETITSWLDLSGNNHHAVQLTQDKRPKFSESGMNGKGVMVFDGSNDYLAILDKYYSSKSIENISIFAVIRKLAQLKSK